MRIALPLLLLACWPMQVGADGLPSDEMTAVRSAVQSGEALSLSVILPGVMALQPGEILDVKFRHQESGAVYVISILAPDWQIWTWVVDAKTGKVLNPPPARVPGKNEQS